MEDHAYKRSISPGLCGRREWSRVGSTIPCAITIPRTSAAKSQCRNWKELEGRNFCSIDGEGVCLYFAGNSPAMRQYVIIPALTVLLLNGCKKSDSGSSTTTVDNQPPAITAIGTPAGSPVTKTIGTGGGTLTSADGRLQLTIPANALTANTAISIQPVTNTAPGGIGLSYHLMPDGTKFSNPVTLTFHYTSADAGGTLPAFFYIAFQDSADAWEADFKNRNVDTTAKTAQLSIRHFSIWSLGAQLNMFASPGLLSEGEQSGVTIYLVKDQGKLVQDASGDYELSTLPPAVPIPNNAVSNWKVNGTPGGNSTDGTIAGSGSAVTYTAPAKIDKERTVQVSAELNYEISDFNNGKLVSSVNKIILFAGIALEPGKLSFSIDAVTTITNTSEVYNDVYTDEGTFQVDVDHNTVTVSNFSNQAPKVTPPSGTVGTTQADWQNDGTGITNITGGVGILTPDRQASVILTHTGTVIPKWKITDLTYGTSYTFGGTAAPGEPPSITFIAKDSAQKITFSNGGTLSVVMTVTPIH